MTGPDVIRFLLLAVLWGSSFSLIKVALEGLAPGQLVLARLVLGAAVLLVIVLVKRVALPNSWPLWWHVAVTALLGSAGPALLLSYAEQSVGAGMAGVLVGITPLATLLVATAVLPTERATGRKTVGFVVGFAGIVLVIAPWGERVGSTAGLLACLGAAVSYALGYVYVRRFLSDRGLPPLALAAAQLVAAVGLQLAAMPVLAWRTPEPTARVMVSILLLGVLSTGLAYVLYFRLIGDVGATTASAVNYIVPVVGVLTAAAFLGETITWNLIAGGIVVLLGMSWADGRLIRSPAGQA